VAANDDTDDTMRCELSVAPSGAAASDDRLTVSGITVRFGGLTALDAVSLTVAPGEIVGLIGPNGAGKTTLFNVICGLATPRSGRIEIDGRPRPRASRLAAVGVARTFQALGLFAGLTVGQNVAAGLSSNAPGVMAGLLGTRSTTRFLRDGAERADAALTRVGLSGISERRPDSLSYPDRKRVALARALVSEPRLLLLDEPAGGLGADDIAQLERIIRAEAGHARQCSVLLVEHHVDLVMAVCDSIVVLDSGRVIARGTPQQIQQDDAVTEAYLGVELAATEPAT
jgi:branched-chain amino acid transport system ATP-binding protein